MGTVLGPITCDDDVLLPQVQAVAAAIPPAIAGMDAPGEHHVESTDRMGAPAWSFGYTPRARRSWCNPKRHVVAHEYAHGWWARHGRQVGGNAALLALVDHPELVGNHEGADFTNRLSEAYAHAFAAAIGQPDGVQESFFKVKIPPANFAALLLLMSKALAVATRPTHTYRRALAVALRASPQVGAPVVAWAESGHVIKAPDSLSGGLYSLAAPGGGLQSRAWLVVVAHQGELLAQPLYTAELAWASLAAEAPLTSAPS